MEGRGKRSRRPSSPSSTSTTTTATPYEQSPKKSGEPMSQMPTNTVSDEPGYIVQFNPGPGSGVSHQRTTIPPRKKFDAEGRLNAPSQTPLVEPFPNDRGFKSFQELEDSMAHGSSKPRSLSANEKKKFDTMQSAVLGYKEYIDARRNAKHLLPDCPLCQFPHKEPCKDVYAALESIRKEYEKIPASHLKTVPKKSDQSGQN